MALPGGIWEVATGKQLATQDHRALNKFLFSWDGAAFDCSGFVSNGRITRRLLFGKSKLVQETDENVAWGSRCILGAGELVIQPGTGPETVEAWNVLTHNRLSSIDSADARMDIKRDFPPLVASPDLKMLAWPSYSRLRLCIWNLSTARVVSPAPAVRCLTGSLSFMYLLFSPSGNRLALPGKGYGAIDIFDTADAKLLSAIPITDTISAAPTLFYAFSPKDDALYVAASRFDNRIGFQIDKYDVANGTKTDHVSIQGADSLVRFMCSPAAEFLENVDQWRASQFLHATYPPCHLLAAVERSAAISSDSNLLAICEPTGDVSVWERASGNRVAIFQIPEGKSDFPFLSADGRRLAARVGGNCVLVWDMTFVLPSSPAARSLEELWTDLASADGRTARRAVWEMTLTGDPGAIFLAGKLMPATFDSKWFAVLIDDLENNSFVKRQQAFQGLQELGRAAQKPLKDRLALDHSAEVGVAIKRALAALDGPVQSARIIRNLRAIEILQRINTAKAKTVLQTLGAGTKDAEETYAARAALRRLDNILHGK